MKALSKLQKIKNLREPIENFRKPIENLRKSVEKPKTTIENLRISVGNLRKPMGNLRKPTENSPVQKLHIEQFRGRLTQSEAEAREKHSTAPHWTKTPCQGGRREGSRRGGGGRKH